MIGFVILWSIVGITFWLVTATVVTTKLYLANPFEWLNPIWIYRNYKVNFFGTAVICVLYNLICPVASICYWFYKLCTVGRR